MGNLSLEIFDLPTQQNPNPTTSKYAWLEDDASITITDTSEIFASGDVWSHSFTLNVGANAHIFGSAGEIHGSRLHDVINKRRARLWVMGLPLYLGYLKLDDEAEVNEDGDVEVSFESGQKTFDELIADTKAREVSVGDVVIGVALNRKRVSIYNSGTVNFNLNGLEAFTVDNEWLKGVEKCRFSYQFLYKVETPYVQQWPKLVMSYGKVYDSSWTEKTPNYTNIQTPYDDGHPFCNINICYPFKANKDGEEVAGRGYTMRLGYGKPTTDGGDNQTRFNNAPNFYLLHFIKRLFNDLKIHVAENQALDVEDLRRVFLLNYGCHYEEIEGVDSDSTAHDTPSSLLSRYKQYYMPIIGPEYEIVGVAGEDRDEDEDENGGQEEDPNAWKNAGREIIKDDVIGKVLMRDVSITKDGYGGAPFTVSSVEGRVDYSGGGMSLKITQQEKDHFAYSAYLAYATGDNYPDVEIKEIIEAMKTMFGVRFLFSDDYKQVRIVLLRNIFNSSEVQSIDCEILDKDVKVDNCIRGFRMTYGKGSDDTSFYYKGFNDLFPRASKTWKDTTDKHDYSQWKLDADYGDIKHRVSAMDKTCYVTPVNGNAYAVKVDEDEDVLFPSLFEVAGFMDAEDGDCSGESETINEVQASATPVIMNEVGGAYASLFSGDMKAPTPEVTASTSRVEGSEDPALGQKIATLGRYTLQSVKIIDQRQHEGEGKPYFTLNGLLDIYLSEGFRIRMKDNYSISNGGTPFDEANPGLQFGIMRSSGDNARVAYYPDEIENENPMNDYWEIVPGDGAIDHPDTCDGYGNQWTYNAQAGRTSDVATLRAKGWSVSGNAETAAVSHNYNYGGVYFVCTPVKYFKQGARPGFDSVLTQSELEAYVRGLWDTYEWDFGSHDSWKLILSAKTSSGRTEYADGRFSLKLRAEKLNPNYVEGSQEPDKSNRYLTITNENLRHRGLADQFYKEYSYWVRNARIVKRTVRMEIAQFLSIDKTKRVKVGDVTGFIRKMQFSVSNKTGLSMVEMEIMYI